MQHPRVIIEQTNESRKRNCNASGTPGEGAPARQTRREVQPRLYKTNNMCVRSNSNPLVRCYIESRDVTVTMLVSLNKGTAAMLVSPTNPLGIERYSYANVFFCFG